MKRISGFSLIELLVSMGILGILLALLSMFLVSNQRVTTSQITAATLENDTRLAFLRMNEVISQAQYIFPEGQTLILNGQTFTTGAQAIAVLIPTHTTYCKTSDPGSYCGYAFTVESRTPFESLLGPSEGTSSLALIETFVMHLDWPQNAIPAQENTLYSWSSKGRPDDFRRSPITDSIDSSKTNLYAASKLAGYSDFDRGFKMDDADTSNDLLQAVEPALYLKRDINGKTVGIERSSFIFSRAIPRSMLPN